jgi:hypothetical protein
VPIAPPSQPVAVVPLEPTLVRLSVDRGVIDLPWGLPVVAVAHVWPEPRCAGGWARVRWPVDYLASRFIAPNDLQIGHILEVTIVGGLRCYGWIADVDARRFVLVASPAAPSAVLAAARAFEVWHTAELAAVEDDWRARIARVRQLHDEAG